MTLRLFKRNVRVMCWRESVAADPTNFVVSRYPEQTEITDLRVQFKIEKSMPHGKKPKPNSCDVTITNLAGSTRANLETKPLVVELHAGYDDVYHFMFGGDLRFAMTKMDGPNWETLLQLGDGDCHHRWARTNRSYAPGTTVRQILKDVTRGMNMQLPDELSKDPIFDRQMVNGDVAFGPARDKLTELLAPLGYQWMINNGQLRVLREDRAHPGTIIPIDEEHGMIGSPEFGSPPRSGKPPHMTVRMLLYPQINPGDRVQLTSKVKSGDFRVESVTHEGDTHGDTWETQCEIKPIAVGTDAGTSQVNAYRAMQQNLVNITNALRDGKLGS